MDLAFPIFKLQERADYEREVAFNRVSSDAVERTEPEPAAMARALACEEAIRILKQATGEE